MGSKSILPIRNARIGSLMGLKVIAILLLFWWHSDIPNPVIDLGARTCEFFFVVSGFLVAYNYSSSSSLHGTWKESCMYVKSKLCGMWPLHFVAFLISLTLIPLSNIISLKTILQAMMNLFLLQSWSLDSQTFFAFNGTSWFLSSILFCYFISPFLLMTINSKKRAGISFFAAIIIRLLIEKQQILFGTDLTAWNLHVSPVVRGLEFYLGMSLFPLSYWIKTLFIKNNKYNRIISSMLEILTLVLVIALIIIGNGVWMRGTYVLLFGIFIAIYSWDLGVISIFLNMQFFRKLGSIEFEFFMLHQVIIRIININSTILSLHWVYRSIITFIILLACCLIWKYYFKTPTKKGMEYAFNKIKKVWC